ncbi:MAG TPA: hypothetical protein VF115_03270 [Acidimicrobiia bacterium]
MSMELYERRDELVAERTALIRSMRGVRTLFVASFAEELEERWDWAVRAWLRAHEGEIDESEIAGSRRELDTLHSRAREIANAELSGPAVWGHEGSESEMSRKRAYAPEADGERWTHISPAMERAERKAIEVLERRFGIGRESMLDWHPGVPSEPLVDILETYAESFSTLQKVNIALERVRNQLPRPRPNLAAARLASD